MNRVPLNLILASTLVVGSAAAQIQTFGGDSARKSSVLMFWDQGAKKLAGSYSFTYGSPEWKASYDKYVDSDKDQKVRLGKDDWASLDTSVPLTLGGVKVPAGQWYLGLGRKDGKFFLMVMNASTCREKKIPSWETPKVEAKINVPLRYAKADEAAASLHITAVKSKKDVAKATFQLHWGNHKLIAPIVAHLDVRVRDAAGKKKQ